MPQPQSFLSEFAPRLRGNINSLLSPVVPAVGTQPGARVTKRGTTVVNYSEDLLHDDDFDESDGPRKYGSSRNRREQIVEQAREVNAENPSKQLSSPVETQGIWREWMGKPNFGKLVTCLHLLCLTG